MADFTDMMRSHQGTTFQAQADLRDTLSTRTHSMISGHTRGNRDTMTSHDSGHTRGHRDTMIDVVARARDADVAEFQGAYIDYELLMALVDDIVDCRRAAEQAFAKELEKQWANYEAAVDAAIARISATPAETLARNPNAIVIEVLNVNRFANTNADGFRKALKRHDGVSPHKLAISWKFRLRRDPVRSLYPLLYKASNTFQATKDTKEKAAAAAAAAAAAGEGGVGGAAAAAPAAPAAGAKKKLVADSFKRESTKYWVGPENVAEVISLILVHVPIFVWNADEADDEFGDLEELRAAGAQKGSAVATTGAREDAEHKAALTIAQPCSSVYIDNEVMDMYNDRIRKLEGCQLIRFRWYGSDKPCNGATPGDNGGANDTIFVERKEHHEKWSGKESEKRRFPMNASEVPAFLRGDKEVAARLGKHAGFAAEVQATVTQRQLYPRTRTCCNRIAFQLPHDNDVRLSIDLNLVFIREKVSDDQWFTEDEHVLEEDVCEFPMAVLEVKLGGAAAADPPDWIKSLTRENGPCILENSFSKYIHGTYFFNSNRGCRFKPGWFDRGLDVRDTVAPLNPFGGLPPAAQQLDAAERGFFGWFSGGPGGGGGQAAAPGAPRGGGERQDKNWHSPVNWAAMGLAPSTEPLVAGAVKVEPKTYFANERTFIQWINAGVLLCTIGLGLSTQASGSSSSGSKFNFGAALAVIGIVQAIYAVYNYGRRLYLLDNKQVAGYGDGVGPYVLCGAVFFVFFAELWAN